MKHNKKYEEPFTFCPDISYYLTCNDKEYWVLTIVLACLMAVGTFRQKTEEVFQVYLKKCSEQLLKQLLS